MKNRANPSQQDLHLPPGNRKDQEATRMRQPGEQMPGLKLKEAIDQQQRQNRNKLLQAQEASLQSARQVLKQIKAHLRFKYP